MDRSAVQKNQKMVVMPRVARSVGELGQTDLSIDLDDEAMASLVDAVGSLVEGAEVTRVRVSGPRWLKTTMAEADDLPFEQRVLCVPIKGESTLCRAPTSWEPIEVEVELLDADDDTVATFDVGLDRKSLGVTIDGTKTTVVLSDEDAEKLDEALAMVGPTIELSLEGSRALTTTAAPFGNGDVFTMPEWFASAGLRFFSQNLRLHVVFKAALPEPSIRPLCVDSCHAFRVTLHGEPITRVVWTVHPSTIDCICAAHAPFAPRPPRPKKIVIAFEFCGRRCAMQMNGCSAHPNVPPPSSILGTRACSARRRLYMRCMHTDDAGKNTAATTIPLPDSDSFLGSLAGAAVELMDPDLGANTKQLKLSLDADFQNERLRTRSRTGLHDEELEMRDEITCEMLLAGSFYFGRAPTRPRGGSDLRQRHSTQPPSVFLRDVAMSHSHLMPRA